MVTGSFVEESDFANYFDKWFKFSMDEFKYTNFESIVKDLNAKKFKLSLYYIVSDFARIDDNRNENYGLIFFESANKPFMLYLVYLEVFLKIFYNKNNVTSEFLIKKYLKNKDFNSISQCRQVKTRFRFQLLKTLTKIAVELCYYLNQNYKGEVFEDIFNSFIAGRDYNSSYFKIINLNYRF